jgi:hypothetical protein
MIWNWELGIHSLQTDTQFSFGERNQKLKYKEIRVIRGQKT